MSCMLELTSFPFHARMWIGLVKTLQTLQSETPKITTSIICEIISVTMMSRSICISAVQYRNFQHKLFHSHPPLQFICFCSLFHLVSVFLISETQVFSNLIINYLNLPFHSSSFCFFRGTATRLFASDRRTIDSCPSNPGK